MISCKKCLNLTGKRCEEKGEVIKQYKISKCKFYMEREGIWNLLANFLRRNSIW